jgi:RimJ/RimL family protein N-acetyltransferase
LRKVVTAPQQELRSWLCNKGGENYPVETMCIGQELDGELIAVVGYNQFTKESCQIHVASTNVYWLSKLLLFAIFDYPFNKAKVNVILAPIYKDNVKSLNLCRKLGFVTTETTDELVIMSMKRNQCKWLQQGEGHGCSN